MLFLYSIIYFIPVLPIIFRQSVLSCLIMMSTLFADVAFTYILIRFFSVIYNLLLFLVNRFRLLFFTRIIVDKHGVKIVPQTIDKSLFRMYFYPRSASAWICFSATSLIWSFSVPATHPLFWHPMPLPFSLPADMIHCDSGLLSMTFSPFPWTKKSPRLEFLI